MIMPWDNQYLDYALQQAGLSRDPATRVGAVIVSPYRDIRAIGFNRFPTSIEATPERMNDRATKLDLIVHAEMGALMHAARLGVSVHGCTLFLAATDDTGLVWGGPPCTRCTVHAIEAGISRIVSRPQKAGPSKWRADLAQARALLCEAAIPLHEVPCP